MESAAAAVLTRAVEMDTREQYTMALLLYQEGVQILLNTVKGTMILKFAYIFTACFICAILCLILSLLKMTMSILLFMIILVILYLLNEKKKNNFLIILYCQMNYEQPSIYLSYYISERKESGEIL